MSLPPAAAPGPRQRKRNDHPRRQTFPDNIFDYRFVALSHNTVRGAAGSAVLNAELLIDKGLL
jgi:hypothetical protein